MVLTVTLNPAIDVTYYVDSMTAGQEVVRVNRKVKTMGGGGINVSKAICILGGETIATGIIGGDNVRYILNTLNEKKIDSDFIEIEEETRICTSVIEDESGRHTRFLEKGPLITAEELERFINKYIELMKKSNIVVLSGSVAEGIGKDIYAQLIKLAKKNNKLVVLDTYKEFLQIGLGACPDIITPNREEFGAYLNRSIETTDEAVAAAKELNKKGIETVIVSLGAQGAAFVQQDKAVHCKPPVVKEVNFVGCGDTLVAGYVYAIEKGLPFAECARIAIAASAANIENEDNAFFELPRFRQILEQVEYAEY